MEAYLLIAPAWFNQALCLPLLGKCLASRKPKPAGFLSPRGLHSLALVRQHETPAHKKACTNILPRLKSRHYAFNTGILYQNIFSPNTLFHKN